MKNAYDEDEFLKLKSKAVFVRTVTMNYCGRITRVTPTEIVLEDASWIADTGTRLSNFLKGEFSSSTEIEPFHDKVIVPRTAIIDATIWSAALPREQR
jgi:hypothetical protein